MVLCFKGIKIIGGLSEDDDDDRDFGIFVRKVLPGGLAEKDGKRICKIIHCASMPGL